jgi:DNA repair protein RadC
MFPIIEAEHETDRDREHFWIIGLDNKLISKYIELISLGGWDRAVVQPREVFRFALMKAATSVILCHNHTSGNPQPSDLDSIMTKECVEAGRLLGIKVLDHIIIGTVGTGSAYFSFAECGMIGDTGWPGSQGKTIQESKPQTDFLERCADTNKRISSLEKQLRSEINKRLKAHRQRQAIHGNA